MMLLLDPAAVARFVATTIVAFDVGEYRNYYCTRPDDERLALVVCRHNLRLPDLAGQIVDATLGWDAGTGGFVWHARLRHSKVTIYAVLHEHRGRAERSLSHVLDDAPRRPS